MQKIRLNPAYILPTIQSLIYEYFIYNSVHTLYIFYFTFCCRRIYNYMLYMYDMHSFKMTTKDSQNM
jgi:hypothetical protein